MRKKLALLLALAFAFICLAGCDLISFTDPAVKRRESIANFLDKDVTGKAGETYKTKWFEFAIDSIEKADAYKTCQAKKGHQLYVVLVTVKSIGEEPVPMGIFDFYMDAPDFTEYIWPIPPVDDTMMPEEYDLESGETVQYTMIFEVPTDTTGLALLYTENYEGGNDGATFSIDIE